MHKPRFRLALIAGLLALSPLAAAAADADQKDSEKFDVRMHRQIYTQKSMSARARGLGGSYAALANGAAGVFENPAGLGAQTNRQGLFEISFDEIASGGRDAEIVNLLVGGAINLNATAPHYWPREHIGNHTFGLMIRHTNIEVSGRDGLESDLTAFTVAYGRSFRGGAMFGGVSFSFGMGEYADDDRLIDQDPKVWEFKVGAIVRPTQELSVGATLSLGRNTFKEHGRLVQAKGHGYEFELRGGVAYEVDERTLVVGDIMHGTLENYMRGVSANNEHTLWKFSGGLERIVIPERVTVRGGLYYFLDSFDGRNTFSERLVDDWFGFTGGVSYYKDLFEFGYTLDIRTSGEVLHYFKVQIDW